MLKRVTTADGTERGVWKYVEESSTSERTQESLPYSECRLEAVKSRSKANNIRKKIAKRVGRGGGDVSTPLKERGGFKRD